MDVTLIIDDLFIEKAYRGFLKTYIPMYGDVVKKPLSYQDVSAVIGRGISPAHVFYLDDRPSSFLKRHIVPLVRLALKEAGKTIPEEITEDDVLDYANETLGISLPDLTRLSTDPIFHSCELLTMEASEFGLKANNLIILGDDPAYEITRQVDQLLFIRLESEQTRMPGDVRWIDIDHVFCTACNVLP
jgi:hypothetical protein